MNDYRLTADERAILDLAREQEGPDPERIDRIHRDVMKAVAAGAVGTAAAAQVAAATSKAAAEAGTLALTTTAKFWLTNAVIIVGLAGAGAVAGVSVRPDPTEPASSAAAVAAGSVDPEPSPAATTRASAAEPPRQPTGDDAPTPPDPSAAAIAPTATSTSLDDEVELLARAQQRLRDGDPRGALRLLDEHDRTFPRGALEPEAAAARVFALCKSGRREEARRAAAAFVARAPSSPLAKRVRDACPRD